MYMPSCGGLKLEQMHEGMDLLYECRAETEKEVFF